MIKQKYEELIKKYDDKYDLISKSRFIFFIVLLVLFSEARIRLANASDVVFFMSIMMLIILFGLLYILFDKYTLKLKLKDILRNNTEQRKNINKLSMQFKSIKDNIYSISSTAIKYQYCWEFLKNALQEDNEMVNVMSEIEKLSEEVNDSSLEKVLNDNK